MATQIHVGVLALQGAFEEHLRLLRYAATATTSSSDAAVRWTFAEVRTATELSQCDALIIPGGESTAISLVASRSGLLDHLRDFVKLGFRAACAVSIASAHVFRVYRKPTWGTCAGLILLAESANRTKKGGQELIGGLDVRVNRNHFGRQTESFETELALPFLAEHENSEAPSRPYRGIFIRAPIVERLLPAMNGAQVGEGAKSDTVIAPSRNPIGANAERSVNQQVEVMATLPGRKTRSSTLISEEIQDGDQAGDIVAVMQGNVFGTSFHPELTTDARIHIWWLERVRDMVIGKRENGFQVVPKDS